MARLMIEAATDAWSAPEHGTQAPPRKAHEFITEDPYLVEEDVRLSQAENHLDTLAHIWTQMGQYLQEKKLDYRLTSDLEFNAIPAAYLEGTGYRWKVAFDIGLWASPPAPKRLPHRNLGSISWPEWGAPRLVLEVLSEQTEQVDRREKRQICRRMGVYEFWLFDPRKETRALEGWRLDDASLYQPIAVHGESELDSEVLETRLRGHNHKLEWWDRDLNDWYSAEKQSHAEGRAEGHAEGRAEGYVEGQAKARAATLIDSLMSVARFYLDAERLDPCLEALKKCAWEDLPSVETFMQAVTSAQVPAAAAEAVLLGSHDERPEQQCPEAPDTS